MSDVDHLPAFDRVQSQGEPSGTGAPVLLRVALALLVLGAVGWAAARWWPSDTATGDVLVQMTTTARTFRPDLVTVQPDEAQAYVLETLGWAVAPPDLPGLALVGVGLASVGTVRASSASAPVEVQVPSFRYEGGDRQRATVFAYDYILLDRIGDSYDLPSGTYAGLSEPTPVDSRVIEGTYVVTWRRRAMIFSAVTEDEQTADRIRQAVGV